MQLTETDKYIFDNQGFIVLHNVLTESEINRLKNDTEVLVAHLLDTNTNDSRLRVNDLTKKAGDFIRLSIGSEIIRVWLSELLGQYRLDHSYLHYLLPNKQHIYNYHCGNTPFDVSQYYLFKDNKMYNSLVSVVYELEDVSEYDGGFTCIPGSHKANYKFPNEWIKTNISNPLQIDINLNAGDALIFTEALTHGTLPWYGNKPRTTLFFKYSNKCLAWNTNYPNYDERPGVIAE